MKGKFLDKLDQYCNTHGTDIRTVCDQVGIANTRISEIRSGKIPFTGTYLEPFIWAGVFKVADVYDGKAENGKEKDFWIRMTYYEAKDLIDIMQRLKTKGLDVRDILLKALSETSSE